MRYKKANVIRYGGGLVAEYSHDICIDSLIKIGYSIRDTSDFASAGCWEIQVFGITPTLNIEVGFAFQTK